MSSRPFIKPHAVINAVSMGASITSDVTILNYNSGVSYDVSWTGTPTGTFSVEVSNTYSVDPSGAVSNSGNWSAVTLTGSVAPAGADGNGMINLAGLEVYAIRLKYTRTSGTGTASAVIVAKVQ